MSGQNNQLMNKFFLLTVLAFFTITNLSAQGLENDNMVLFMKANVLFDSGRYDEAVRMYNRILSQDEEHTQALFMRSKAKYELSAFKGTKNDILLFIEKVGINKQVIQLMAQTELKLSNFTAAGHYVETAIELDPYDDSMHLLSGEIALATDMRNEACERFASAAQLGSDRAVRRMNEYCLGYKAKTVPDNDIPKDETQTTYDEDGEQQEEPEDDGIVTLDEIVREAERSNNSTEMEEEADTEITQELEIDSKLSISVSGGLGNRTVTKKPSIFMLSDQDGIVVIALCINRDGNVTEASFDREMSTIYRSSLTSLALRKAKEFVFNASSRSEQCGTMTYHIKS